MVLSSTQTLTNTSRSGALLPIFFGVGFTHQVDANVNNVIFCVEVGHNKHVRVRDSKRRTREW